jgi:hypothetical protein
VCELISWNVENIVRTENYLSTSCQGGPHLSGRTHWGCSIELAPAWCTDCHPQVSHKNPLKNKVMTMVIMSLTLKQNSVCNKTLFWVLHHVILRNRPMFLRCLPPPTPKQGNIIGDKPSSYLPLRTVKSHNSVSKLHSLLMRAVKR